MIARELTECTPECIHFVLGVEIPREFPENIYVVRADIFAVASKDDLLRIIAEALEFPAYFGNNWDALDECLSDMSWAPAGAYALILNGAGNAWKLSPYAMGKFLMSWLYAHKQWSKINTPFHLILVMD